MPQVTLMTQAEYAAHRGVSHVAVHKAIKEGRISTIGGKIDPKVADIQWAQNTRPRANRRRTTHVQHGGRDGVSAPAVPPMPQQVPASKAAQAAAALEADDYWVSRARREAAEAAIAEMRRAEMDGRLVSVEAVRSVMARRLTATREALLQIPHRLASVLAAEADADRVAHVLDDAIRHALSELARDSALSSADDGQPGQEAA